MSRVAPRDGGTTFSRGRTISGMTALGVSLLLVGAIMILIEAHVPTLGVLGGPGVVALGVGAVLAVLGLGGGVILGVVAALLLAGVGGRAARADRRQGRSRCAGGGSGPVPRA